MISNCDSQGKGRIVSIPYGKKQLQFTVPGQLLFDGVMKQIAPLVDFESVLRQRLNQPVGCAPLAHEVQPGTKVLILVEDNTRNTPVKQILPVLIDYLQYHGVAMADIEILTAPGTHRVMTAEELIEKVGRKIYDTVTITQHDFRIAESMIDLGSVKAGDYDIPIHINKKVKEVDCIIGIGNIVPHCDAGFSAGAKILQPGICGYTTTAATHVAAALLHEIPLGVTENPCRHGMEEVAKRAGLTFIVNTIMNYDNEVIDIVAGDFVEAHRKGAAVSADAFGVDIPELADIVVVSSSPADLDYWQAEKGIISAYFAVKKGGIIIFVTPCDEGLAHNHPRFREWLRMSYAEAVDKVKKTSVEDPEADLISADLAICNARVREKASIYCVSHGLSNEEMPVLGYKKFETVQDAVDTAFAVNPGATIGILPRGGDCLPVSTTGRELRY